MTLKQRVDRHDREIAAIRKLVLTGMKMLNRLDDRLEKLTTSQQETDRMLKDLIRALRGGGNGHAKRRIDVQ